VVLPGADLGLVCSLAADLKVGAAPVADPSSRASSPAPAVRRGTRLVLLLVATFALSPATVSAAPPTPSPSPSPSPSPPPTPTPSPTPVPTVTAESGTVSPDASFYFAGDNLPPSQALPVLWDSRPIGAVSTNAAGAFSTTMPVPAGAQPGTHQICVQLAAANACTGVTVGAPAAASPTPSPSPSPTPSLAAPSASTGRGDLSPLALVLTPPFVFLPVLLVIGLLGLLGVWLWRRSTSEPALEVTEVHALPTPRRYPTPPPIPSPPPPAAPSQPIVYETPETAPPPSSSPPRAGAPDGADVPPDLPEAGD
jgi:hypothetical protein